jgi:DNA mismatch repair protein MutL
MSSNITIPPVRILPEDLVNKIAAGEVVERPASVVKELVENSIDAQASRIIVRMVAAGRRTIEVIDNGHGMSEQDAMLAIERHATSKIRKAEDLDAIRTLGFRGEALASIAAVSRFELLTRRAKDDSGVRIRIDGGILRDVSHAAAPVGTRISVNRLYFNTPVRAKFLKGITTELSHCIDAVQRHALAHEGVGFHLLHNEKTLLDIPDKATLRERVALIWGLNFAREMLDVDGEQAGFKVRGLIGAPGLTRSQRSHQFFFMNGRPVVNRSLQYGLEDGYRGLVTIGRHPVGVVLLETHPRFVDVNIHPAKREIRFRDERAAHDALREVIRDRLAAIESVPPSIEFSSAPVVFNAKSSEFVARSNISEIERVEADSDVADSVVEKGVSQPRVFAIPEESEKIRPVALAPEFVSAREALNVQETPISTPAVQTELPEMESVAEQTTRIEPQAMYKPVARVGDAPLQVFDTYLIVPEEDRLLIIDQHALHERLTYDALRAELEDTDYAAQQLVAPLLVDVPPSHVKLVESNIGLFSKLGLDLEPFGGNTFQVTAVCHLYEESRVPDIIYRVLDELAQGDLFDRENLIADLLRLAVEACRSSVKAGDYLAPEERRGLLDGFRRLRPPYTCPHGRPIIVELTQMQMEKSFRRRQ